MKRVLPLLALFTLTSAQAAPKKASPPPAAQAIDPRKFDDAALSDAIFRETNRRRAEKGLPALLPEPSGALRKAAQRHSDAMAKTGELTHNSPGKSKTVTPIERLLKVKLDPVFAAENIGFDFLVRYESGRRFYLRPGKEGLRFSYEPKGPFLPNHTYQSFAELIVNEWMNSPRHRDNLLDKRAKFLGTGAALRKVEGNMDRVYATQEFYTPRQKMPWE
jgi:uncharacterized protein YkwD